MGKKCPNCGAINTDDVVTCEYCGVDLGMKAVSYTHLTLPTNREV